LKINKAGLNLIKEFEGCELKAYTCPANICTIGYGHTRSAKPGMSITKEKAIALLEEDLGEFESFLSLWAEKNRVVLNQNEFSALVSFIYNIGPGAFTSSTAAQRLKKGDRKGAAEAMTWWNKGDNSEELPGLVRRRAAEKTLFLTP
jgi:lysozyme